MCRPSCATLADIHSAALHHCRYTGFSPGVLMESCMNISNLKIGVRLAVAFGAVLLLMAVLIGVGLQRLNSISRLNAVIIDKDWVKADAAATVGSTTRANAALTLELFTTNDAARTAEIYREMDVNKKTISAALEIRSE